jgi:hypothetical protein
MIAMKSFKGFAAALLLAASCLPVHAEDAPAATTPPSAAAPSDAKPAAVPRPSIAPKATDEATDAAPATSSEAPRRHRRAGYRYRHYAYWQPFPIYFPHLYRHHIVWNRYPWF